MTPSEWYVGLAGEKIGPLSTDEVLARRERNEIADETLVWRDGMVNWAPFSESELSGTNPRPFAPELFGGGDRVRCAVSGESRPASEMLQYGDAWIAPEHKETFLQGLREGRQPASLSWGGYLYRDPGPTARIAWWLIVSSTIFGGLITSATLLASFLAPEGSPFETQPVWIAVNTSFSCVYLLVFVATAVWFCLWIYRVAANGFAFGASWVRVSPGWAVGWHFVPIAFFWMPYLAMADISRASQSPETGESDPVPGIVKTWWILWVGSNVFSFLSGVLVALGFEVPSLIVSVIYLPLGIGAAWAACRMIRSITLAQQQVASRGRDPAGGELSGG